MIGSIRRSSQLHVARLLWLLGTTTLAACAVPSSEEMVGASSEALTLVTLPTTIQAVAMTTKTAGGRSGQEWNLYSNGYLAEAIKFPSGYGLTLSIDAHGTPYHGGWPNMQVRIDNQVIANVTVSSTTLHTYQVAASVTSGTHQIAIAFTNDGGGGGEDRNLYVKSLTIASGTPAPPTTTAPPPPPSNPPPATFDVKTFLASYGPLIANEGKPSGVPSSWDWANASTATTLVAPPNTGWINWWAVVAVDLTQTRPANTRVEFRSGHLLVLPAGSNTWMTYFQGATVDGDGFKADFSGPCTYGGVSLAPGALSLDPQARCLDHFWPSNPAFQSVGSSIRAAISVGAVRLIKADPNGPDDRASSHFLIEMGSDWRSPDGSCESNSSGELVCASVAGGRFVYPKVAWRAAVMSTMTAQDLASLPLPSAEAFRLPDGTLPTE